MAKSSPGASRVHRLLRAGVSVSVSISGGEPTNIPPPSCTTCRPFIGMTPTKVGKAGIKICAIIGWLLSWVLTAVLLWALPSCDILGLTGQRDVLLEMELSGLSCWRRNFPGCHVYCNVNRLEINYERLQITCIL